MLCGDFWGYLEKPRGSCNANFPDKAVVRGRFILFNLGMGAYGSQAIGRPTWGLGRRRKQFTRCSARKWIGHFQEALLSQDSNENLSKAPGKGILRVVRIKIPILGGFGAQ